MHFNISYVKTNINLVNIYLHYLTVTYKFDMMCIILYFLYTGRHRIVHFTYFVAEFTLSNFYREKKTKITTWCVDSK